MAESQTTPKLKDCPYVLVVEGYSDLLFYAEALESVGLHGRVFIQQFGGKDNLKRNLQTEMDTLLSAELLAEKAAVAVILDADTNAAGQVQSLAGVLQKITNRKLIHGVWSKGQPHLGFFVVPDGQQTGEVETLAWNAWANDPQNAGPKNCIEQYLDCMTKQGHNSQSPDKGKIGALLAVKYDEDPRLGPGARANVFDFNRPEFEPLLKFLRGFTE